MDKKITTVIVHHESPIIESAFLRPKTVEPEERTCEGFIYPPPGEEK